MENNNDSSLSDKPPQQKNKLTFWLKIKDAIKNNKMLISCHQRHIFKTK